MGMKAGTQNGCTAQETTSKAQQKMEEGVVLIIHTYIYNIIVLLKRIRNIIHTRPCMHIPLCI